MSKKARLVKGSLAAKRHMAKLRRLAIAARKAGTTRKNPFEFLLTSDKIRSEFSKRSASSQEIADGINRLEGLTVKASGPAELSDFLWNQLLEVRMERKAGQPKRNPAGGQQMWDSWVSIAKTRGLEAARKHLETLSASTLRNFVAWNDHNSCFALFGADSTKECRDCDTIHANLTTKDLVPGIMNQIEGEVPGAKSNPLTKQESRMVLGLATKRVREASKMAPHLSRLRTEMASHGAGLASAVSLTGPKAHRGHVGKIMTAAKAVIRGEEQPFRQLNPLVMTVMGNPGPRYAQRKDFQQFLARKRNEFGSQFDPSKLASKFVPYYESGERIEVQFSHGEVKRGRVGVTTGWQPVFLLILTTRSMGSSDILGPDDKVIRTVSQNPEPCNNPGHLHRNPVDYQDVYTAAQKVGYSVHDAARVASAFKRTGEMPRTVEAQLRYFKSNPEIKRVSTPPHFTVTCIGCGKKFNTLHEPAYADLQGEAFKAYYCRPCAVRACGREGLRSNPFEVRRYVKGKLDSVQADPYARGMKTSFKTRDEAERVFSDIGADRAQGYRIVETDSLGRARKPSKVKKAPLRADVVGVEVEPVKVWGGRASVVDDLKEANRFSVYFRTKKGPAEWVKDFSIHYPNAALRFANELALKYQVAVIAPRLPEGWGALVPNRNPVEGWVVTKDGETIKTFPGATDDFPAAQFLHTIQGQSIDYAVRHGGYDIVCVRGGKVVHSYKRDMQKKRNPSAGETWAIVPASSRPSAGYTAAFKGTLQQAIKSAQASASIHKVNYEVWSTDDRNYRREGWLLKKHAITRPHGGYEIVRSNPSPKIRWEVHSSTEGVWVVGPLSKNEFPRLYGYRDGNFGSYANAMKYATAKAKKYGLTVTDVTTAKSNPGVTPLDPKQYAGQDPELCASCGESLRHMGFREGRALFMCTSCGAKYSVKRGKAKRQSNPRLRIEYKRVDTTTLQGLRQAERLHQAGWKQGQVTPFSIQFYRKPSPDAVDRERVRRGMKPLQKPQANPRKGTRRKVTMTLEAFAKMVKAKNDPKLWSAFMKKVQDYKKWSHGTLPKKVTVEQIDVPGMSGMWMTYDAGKAPETAYVMPSGTKRKGAWVHQWDTMPDIKNDPDTGIVLTKLKGKSRITDFYHR